MAIHGIRRDAIIAVMGCCDEGYDSDGKTHADDCKWLALDIAANPEDYLGHGQSAPDFH